MIADEIFSCAETPVWFTPQYNKSSIPKCLSCTLRLTAAIAGPGTVSPRVEGLLVDENPLVTLTVNGIQHNLLETILTFPGAHRMFERQSPCEAELQCYFRSINDITKYVCLCIPLDIGVGPSTQYFTSLDTGVRKDRPTLASVLPTGSLFSYVGPDMRGRSAADSTPRKFCDPIAQRVTYYVYYGASKINASDFTRLQQRAGNGRKGPPKPASPPTAMHCDRLLTHIDGLIVGNSGSKSVSRGASTKALKCYKLDREKDIQGDTVYIGGPETKPSTLEKELAATDLSIDDATRSSIQPGDIERWIGIGLGILIGLFLCSLVAYLIWKYTFTNYLPVQKLYKNPFLTKLKPQA